MNTEPRRSEVTDLPLLALRSVVWFPRVQFTLFVKSEPCVRAAASAMINGGRLAAFALRDDRSQRPVVLEELFDMGVMATLMSMARLPDGSIKLTVMGIERILASGEISDNGNFRTIQTSTVKLETFPTPPNFRQTLEDVARRITALRPLLSDSEFSSLPRLGEPGYLADLIGSRLTTVPFGARQELLETLNPWQRLQKATALLGAQSAPPMDTDEAAQAISEWLQARLKKIDAEQDHERL